MTGGGVIAETSTYYKKVTTPLEFLTALAGVKKGTTKVIEIANDLDLGDTEVTSAYPTATTVYSGFRSNKTVKLHPTLKTTGVSLIDIQNFSGLTIYSKNGARIRHSEWNIKNGSNMIIRNLVFDEMWEWDESTKGNYDSNDWDYMTLSDGDTATNLWIDHCTFYKTYDGIVDMKKGTMGVTISWSQILPGDSSNGAFIKAQFDALETSRSSYTMYNFLRNYLTEDQIIQIASTVKKGHLLGATDLESGNAQIQVTLEHNYYKDLQDRMPRLRGGDAQVFNVYADSSNARVIKNWYDAIVAANAALKAKVDPATGSPSYHFGITSNGTISTESAAIEVDNSIYYGVLTPLRNNQTDVTNSAYTGAIVAYNTRHILLSGTDSTYMSSPQSTYTDSNGTAWMVWQGANTDTGSSLGPIQAPTVALSWHNGTPPTPKYMHSLDALPAALATGAGAGKISMTAAQWMNPTNTAN